MTKIALLVLALIIIGAALIVAGIGYILGVPFAMICAGIFIFAGAIRLQSRMMPRG